MRYTIIVVIGLEIENIVGKIAKWEKGTSIAIWRSKDICI